MQLARLVLTFFLALGVSALPVESTDVAVVEEPIISPRDPKKPKHHGKHKKHKGFYIHVHNKCPFVKEVALYQVTPDFQMKQKSKPTNIQPGHQHTIHASFKATGMRLSGHAERGVGGQWGPQALFEFGYSEYAGKKGTAYNLSVMKGSDPNIGIGVYPRNKSCESKTCFPWDCAPSQGWTDPGQTSLGSPADTVCYGHKTDFKVVFCP